MNITSLVSCEGVGENDTECVLGSPRFCSLNSAHQRRASHGAVEVSLTPH